MAVLHRPRLARRSASRGPATGFSLRRYHGWQIELDIRAIKQTLKMEHLVCKTPAMVRRELWAHLLGYNLVRKVLAQAAVVSGLSPRQLSFAGGLQTLEEFRWLLLCGRGEAQVQVCWQL